MSTFIPLSRLPDFLPPNRNGKKRHRSAVYRWAKDGVRGVRLQCWQLPDGLYTTLEAVNAFYQQLTAKSQPTVRPLTQGDTAKAKRQADVESEIAAVRATLRTTKGGQ